MKIIKFEDQGDFYYEFRLLPAIGLLGREDVDNEVLQEIEQELCRGEITPAEAVATTVARVVQARVRQDVFRRAVIEECGSRCAFTEVSDKNLLIAGHLKPWAVSSSPERLDPQNGLVFTPTYDKLFNDGLISFDHSRELLISPIVGVETRLKLSLVPGTEIDIPLLGQANSKRQYFMEYHRINVFRG